MSTPKLETKSNIIDEINKIVETRENDANDSLEKSKQLFLTTIKELIQAHYIGGRAFCITVSQNPINADVKPINGCVYFSCSNNGKKTIELKIEDGFIPDVRILKILSVWRESLVELKNFEITWINNGLRILKI